MRVYDYEQRSPEWYAIRRGLPTASEFGRIITPKKMEYAAGADTYINELIDELVRPDAAQVFNGNRHTERGVILEPEARALYEFEREVTLQQVGFITDDAGTMGCSPDSLVQGDAEGDGGLEVKCPDGPTHVKWMRTGGLPDDHKAQVHGNLILTGAPWWDFLSYCPGYDRILIRVRPDTFTENLAACLQRFVREYADAREQFFREAA